VKLDQTLLICFAAIARGIAVAKLSQTEREVGDGAHEQAVADPPTASAKLDFSFKGKTASVRLTLALELFLTRFASLVDRLLFRG
jgi:hypothetical protein